MVAKLLEDPSVVVIAEDSLTELAASAVCDVVGSDCPLAGIGTMLVVVALVVPAELEASPVAKVNDVA